MLKEALPNVTLDSSRQVAVMGRMTPTLRNGPTVINLDCSIPDRFTAQTGVTATIFARCDADFIRVSTSVKKQGGERAMGTVLNHAHPAYGELLAGRSYVGYATLFGTQYLTQYDPLKDARGHVIGALYVGIDVSGERRVGLGMKIGSLCFACTALLLLAFTWHFAARAAALAGAQADEIVSLRNVQLFVGVLAALGLGCVVTLVIRAMLNRPLIAARDVAQRLAAGDLRSQLHVDRNDDIGQLMQAINGIGQGLSDIVGNVRSGAQQITAAAREIATGNADLSARTSEQAASLEETASSMAQLTTTVKQNDENAAQANRLVLSAAEIAAKGRSVVDRLVEMMGSIKASSAQITRIVTEIEDIAFQTNILALNAAVEAARAGEHGRSFSIVAADVRNLAKRSDVAAKEIKSLINSSVLQVDDGSAMANQAGRTMAEIVSSVKRVTDIMGEISAASHEQSSGIEQINTAVGRMDEMTQHNAALVEQAAAAAETLHEQAQKLAREVEVFKVK
jgi:methyl-accepting chemotaxis protein-2 (aspartate sensor receptor)